MPAPNSNNAVRRFFSAGIYLTLLVKIFFILYSLNKGFDFLDEPFNYLILQNPGVYKQYVHSLLINFFLPFSVIKTFVGLRVLFVMFEVVCFFILLFSVHHFNRSLKRETPAAYWFGVIIVAGVFNSSLEYYSNYNSITFHLAELSFAGLLLAFANKEKTLHQMLFSFLAFLLAALILLAKPQSGVLLLFVIFAAHYHFFRSLKLTLLAASGGLVCYGIIALAIQPLDMWIESFHAFYTVTQALGYTLGDLLVRYGLFDFIPWVVLTIMAWLLLQLQAKLTQFILAYTAALLLLLVVTHHFFREIFTCWAVVFHWIFLALFFLKNASVLPLSKFSSIRFLLPASAIVLSLGTKNSLSENMLCGSGLLAAGWLLAGERPKWENPAVQVLTIGFFLTLCLHFYQVRIRSMHGVQQNLFAQTIPITEHELLVDAPTFDQMQKVKQAASKSGINAQSNLIVTDAYPGFYTILGITKPFHLFWGFSEEYRNYNLFLLRQLTPDTITNNTYLILSSQQESDVNDSIYAHFDNLNYTLVKTAGFENVAGSGHGRHSVKDSFEIFRVVKD